MSFLGDFNGVEGPASLSAGGSVALTVGEVLIGNGLYAIRYLSPTDARSRSTNSSVEVLH